MQVIKAIVIGMGLLIVAGMALLVYGLTSGFDAAKGGDGAAAFGTIRATLPSGAISMESNSTGVTSICGEPYFWWY